MAPSSVPLALAPRLQRAVPAGNTYLCLAVLDGVLCVIFLHGRNSPQSSPSSTPRLLKSLSFELQPSDLIERPMSPMQYARSGLGTAELNGKLIAAGELGLGHRARGRAGASECGASNLSLCRGLQQGGVPADRGVLRPREGRLDVHRTHEDAEGTVPDGSADGVWGGVQACGSPLG